jgi:charged multivesicular body protein 7
LSIGDRLIRDYTQYTSLPITTADAQAAGWEQSSSDCDPNLGIAWTQGQTSPEEATPITLFFTAQGQMAGIGVTCYGDILQGLIDLGYWQYTGKSNGYDSYFLSVSFRQSDDMCSSSPSTLPLGDSLIVNANNISVSLPLTEDDAINQLWDRGSCFYSMGHHYFYDLVGHPNMTWVAANLLPVVLMFHNGTINAIFFASATVQQGLLSANEWDPIPLINYLMCKNWCDSACTFSDTSAWSTLHVYFRDYTQATCAGGCTTSCCP